MVFTFPFIQEIIHARMTIAGYNKRLAPRSILKEDPMLVIISDVHLGDGTTAESIPANAFRLFSNRLRETAYFASFRQDGTYRPIDSLNLVLLGDILDPLHSTLWLDSAPNTAHYTRPWTSPDTLLFPAKLAETTRAIIQENKESLDLLRKCANGEIVLLPPATSNGRPDHETKERIRIRVSIHYMIGNHDWYYHMNGAAFDGIRKTVIDTMGLSNPTAPFPYELTEYPPLQETEIQRNKTGTDKPWL